jgi:hippurate hydrolase
MTIRNSIAALHDEITAYRRELHRHPQTCYEEEFASNLIAERLTEWGVDFERGWATTGIVAKIEGETNSSGKAIGLRADIDALDIVEQSGQPWASTIPGKMHGCGHDGHTSMLLGAAKYLSENKNFDGTVYLIFQPAEEGGGGAIKMIAEGLFKKHKMDAVFGMHNWPMIPRGKIGMRPGPIMASSDEFEITVKGRGGHAALPQANLDPIPVAAEITMAIQTIISRTVNPLDPAVISITNINAGTGAFNVVPDTAKLTGTVRAFRFETRELMEKRIGEIAKNIAAAHGLTAEYEFIYGYDPTINSVEETTFCADIAKELIGEKNVDTAVEPCMGAEDFGAMLKEVPGCYIWMGQAEPDQNDSPHNNFCHNAGYDFNDEIIPLGIEYWVRLVEARLKA